MFYIKDIKKDLFQIINTHDFISFIKFKKSIKNYT